MNDQKRLLEALFGEGRTYATVREMADSAEERRARLEASEKRAEKAEAENVKLQGACIKARNALLEWFASYTDEIDTRDEEAMLSLNAALLDTPAQAHDPLDDGRV